MIPNIKLYASIGIIVLIVSNVFLFQKTIRQSNEIERQKDNYKNALLIDSLNVSIFKIKKTHELDQLLEQNQQLNILIDESGIETKRIKDLYYQQQRYISRLEQKTDVSEIVQDIRNDVPITKVWQDSTQCLTIKGFVRYANDSLNVGVTSREFKNNVALIKYKGRRKPVKWLLGLRLGQREIKFTPQSECGDIKVQIIEKE